MLTLMSSACVLLNIDKLLFNTCAQLYRAQLNISLSILVNRPKL